MPWTLFKYVYRDADNYKAFRSLALEGILSEPELQRVRELLPDDGFFIAEQLCIPTLYHRLDEFLRKLEEVEEWKPELSSHFWLGIDSLDAAARLFGYPPGLFSR